MLFKRKKCIIKACLFLAFVTQIELVIAQSTQLSTVVLPSPRSQEFEKYINYKVNLSNGLPDITVPFYSISLDGVNIPISISYHASGIKFNQTSGDVGLGWQMNPANRISRTVYGRLDEAYTMPDMNNVSNGQTISYYLNNNFSNAFDRDLYLARYMVLKPGGEIPAIAASQNNYLDGQFDIFTIGLPEENGNFIITDRVNKIITLLNNSGLKINYATDASVISAFTVTNKNGIQYQFGEANGNNEGLQVYENGAYRKYNTAWMLSKVTTRANREISFQYQTITESSSTMPSYNRTIVEGLNAGVNFTPSCVSTTDNNGVVSSSSATDYNSRVLSAINTPNETVTINRNANNTISSILITRPDGTSIRSVSFFYSQPGNGIFLDSLHVNDGDGSTIQRYLFDYISHSVSFLNYDCFGYPISNSGGGYNYANQYGEFDYLQVAGGPSNCSGPLPNHTTFNGINKRIFPGSNSGMLKKITFPTGGTQEFTFENNKFRINSPSTIINGGGFRISQIKSTDPIANTTITRNYYYGNEGVRSFDPTDPAFNVTQKIILAGFFNNQQYIYSLKKTTQSSILDGEIMEAVNQSNNGWYDHVTEDYGEGKIEYTYEIPLSDVGIDVYPTNQFIGSTGQQRPFLPYYLTSYNYWNVPYLKEKTVLRKTAVEYLPVQKESYDYYIPGSSPSDEFIGLKVSPFAIVAGYNLGVQTTPPLFSLYSYSGINSVFNYATYKITRGDVLLKKKTVADYDIVTGEPTTSISEYTYTAGNLISSEKTSSSKGEMLLTNYKYPINYTGLTATDEISLGVKKLIAMNYLTPIIERSNYRLNQDGSNKRLLSSAFFSFKSTQAVPASVFLTESQTPISNFVESSVQNGAITKDDSKYKPRLLFDRYSNIDRIQQQSRIGDVKEVYLWSYNSQYPVAKIVGSDYATVETLLGGSTAINNLENSIPTEQSLNSFLAPLRTGLPKTLVTTFTYKPLVGMTSQTDPSGRITYYEYDGFGRLKLIRDQNSKIIKQFDYQYQVSPTN